MPPISRTIIAPVLILPLLLSISLFRYCPQPGSANDGVVRMLTQLKLQFDLIDPAAALQRYELLVLPDEVAVDAALVARLRRYIKGGGRIVVTQSPKGTWTILAIVPKKDDPDDGTAAYLALGDPVFGAIDGYGLGF